jgi:hypothetical protein
MQLDSQRATKDKRAEAAGQNTTLGNPGSRLLPHPLVAHVLPRIRLALRERVKAAPSTVGLATRRAEALAKAEAR